MSRSYALRWNAGLGRAAAQLHRSAEGLGFHAARGNQGQLLRQADQAMHQAKLTGKNRYHLFDAD